MSILPGKRDLPNMVNTIIIIYYTIRDTTIGKVAPVPTLNPYARNE